MALDLEVATPERRLVHEQATEVELPSTNGYMGVLPGHAPLLGVLGIGHLTYMSGGRRHYLAVHSGFIEIIDDHVRVLADAAEFPNEIDVERAQTAFRRAREETINPPAGVDPAEPLAAMERAQARIDMAAHKQAS